MFNTGDLTELPNTADELEKRVSSTIMEVIGELGTPISISLPGEVPLHDRIFLVDLAMQLAGQTVKRLPWTWMVWLMVRGAPFGLLPEKDVLGDMAGQDVLALNIVNRRFTMRLMDSCILVVSKDFTADKVDIFF